MDEKEIRAKAKAIAGEVAYEHTILESTQTLEDALTKVDNAAWKEGVEAVAQMVNKGWPSVEEIRSLKRSKA